MNIPSFPNSSVSLVLTLILAAVPLAGSPAATLLNRYSFTADANDSIGGANGVLQGGASFSGNAVVLDGSSGYVDLPNGIVSSLDSISVEIWLTNNNSGTWSRIFDFGNSSGGEDVSATGTQYFFLSPQSGSGTLRGAITVGGGEQLVDWSGTALPSGVLKHVVWTYDATSQTARLYVDGTLAGENAAVSLKPSDMGNTLNNWIGRSQWSGDAYLKAGITEFRIYDGALTATEVSDDFNFGPDVLKQSGPVQFVLQPKSQSVTELATVTFTTDFSGTPPVGIQWRRNGFNIPGATNSAYSFTAALTNNNAAYSVVLTNAYLGSAYTVTSTNAVLSVTADTAAPRLLRAVSLFPNEVRVTFSEGLSDVTGTNAANYSITRAGGSLAVTAARFGVANSEVILTTATQSLGTNYTLTVSNVRDCSAAANLIAVGSQTNFVATTFVSADIGNPPISSVQTFTGNGLDASASGSGISGTGDQFSFSYQSYTNDFDVRVRVAGLSFASVWTRAALMARDGLATNAMFAASVATPGPAGCHFESRTGVGGGTTMAGSFPVNYPDTWLRLRRVGNVFDGFASLDGTSWEYLGTSTISMSNIVNVGFALTAGSTTGNVVAQFRDFANATGTITTNAMLPFEPPGPSSRRTALVISEIMYNAPESWAGTNSLEFVELWNSGLITEDLTGHKLTGDISYWFPDDTKLAPGQFLVVAKDPVAAQSFYGVSCLGPYTNKLSNNGGTLRLLNELGARLLEINYDNKAPWPVAADGTGHSLVLSRPSYGENDPRAWSASDVMGGSPGRFEHYGTEPARAVVINEFLAHTDLPQVDSVELFNTSTQSVNLSGVWLSDTAGTNKYRIANGTTIPARGYLVFTDAQLGFGFKADGDAIYLVNSNQTRVLDSVKFSGQENGVSMGRYPNGAPGFQRLATVTLGASNTPPRLSPIVINEIMYNPISGDNNDEYIEIYNRSGAAVNIGGWRLDGGINYAFPSNTIIKAGGYMVVAENLTNLLVKYSQLNATNAFGNYGGTLANGGERLELALPDDLISTNSNGVVVTNIFYITLDELTYGDGGRWGKWSDGGGSSLELTDPDSDNRYAANWADSDESSKATWTAIDVTDVMENGQTGIVNEGDTGQAAANRFELFLQGEGEAILDDMVFLSNGGANLVANGDFASGTNNWVLGGVLRRSYAENNAGSGGSAALHLVSAGRGDTGPNKISQLLSSTAATGAPNTGTMRAQVRWLKGDPYVLLRMRGNWMEVSQRLNVPTNLGTPGLPNSRLIANAGPAITDVAHAPVLPAAGQSVVVTARAADPDGVGSLTLNFRVDPATTYTSVAMLDNGTGGDAVANDGIYSATIPGQADSTLAAFYVTATDGLGASKLFPAEAPTRECHVRWGESVIAGSIGTYRIWVTAANIAFWTARERNANDTIDATFVYGNFRAVYNVDTMYSGSPFHTPAYNGPLASIASDYEVNFHPDELFLGSKAFVLTAFDVADGNFFFNDDSGQVDLTGNWIARKLGQQYNYRRHINVFMNGQRRGTIYDDAQQPNGEMLDEYFSGTDTELRKIESWFEFAADGQAMGSVYATLKQVNKSTGGIDSKFYRWNWRPRATENPDNWSAFTNLVAAVNNTGAPNYEALVRTWMDVPNFLGPVIAHHICGSWDSYDYERGKNMFAARPDGQGWRLQMWDIELSLGAGGKGATDSIYNMFDQSLKTMITSVPAFNREYLRGFEEAVNTSLMPGVADVALDERYAAFQQNGIPLLSPQFIKSYIASRRAYLLTVLPKAEFSVSNTNYQVITGSNSFALTGTGPLSLEHVLVNGNNCAVTWTSITNWRVTVPLTGGTNQLNITGTDRNGVALTNVNVSVTVNYSGATVAPEGFVVFNEIQYQPAVKGAAFVELFNTHSNYTFDLSGWSVNGVDYTFPAGATLPPRGYIVLAEDQFVFNATYGSTNLAFDRFNGSLDADGETLTLLRSGSGTNVIVVDRVRYEAVAPWPVATNGSSLQLMDASQDNSRVANWKVSPAITNVVNPTAQWIYVTKTATLSANASAFYLYLASAGEIYIDDVVLVSGSVAESGANLLSNGDFESALSGTWSLSTDFANSVLSTSVKHGGSSSLRLIATAAGSGSGDSVSHSISPRLGSGRTYTLSFWYLQNTTGSPFVARVSNSSASAGVYVSLNPLVPGSSTTVIAGATPGTANSVATNLPAFPPLWLNELQANNTTGPLDNFSQRDPWTEIVNTGGTNVSLSGYYLSDNYTNLTKWAFAPGNTASNGFTLVWCDNATNQTATGSIHAGLALASGTGSLVLSRSVSNTVQVIDYLNYAGLPANWSYGSVPDAQPFYRRQMFYSTPGATNNGASAPLTVFINEWMADNTITIADPADSKYQDWFELYNPGTNAMDIGGYYLTDNLTNKFQFQIPNNGHYVIPAGGYLLVWADGDTDQNSTNRADLHVGFSLSKNGEEIGMFSADGTIIDAVTFGAQTGNVSEGRFPNGSANIYTMPTPTPRAANVIPNTAPTLSAISNRLVTLGQTLSLTAVGSDTDVPAQTLSYSLNNPPAGAQITSGGLFTWTPSVAPATNTVVVVVTDSGTPGMSATQSFTVVVAPVPKPAGWMRTGNEFTFNWATFAGQQFQVEAKDALSDPDWVPVSDVLAGTGGTLTFTNLIDDSAHRFFRLRVLP